MKRTKGTQIKISKMKPVAAEQFESKQGVSTDVLEEYRSHGRIATANSNVLSTWGRSRNEGMEEPSNTNILKVVLPSGKLNI